MSSAEPRRERTVRWLRWRRGCQYLVAAFFVLLPLSHAFDQNLVLGNLASLRLGPIDLVDPAVGLSTILASRAVSLTLLAGMLLPALLALLVGPVFCSFVCPWGLISELLDRLRPSRRFRLTSQRAAWLRWSVLGGLLALSFASSMPLLALASAPRLLSGLPLEIWFTGGVSFGSTSLLVALCAAELVLPRRLWCRALCPVGSFLVLLRTPWTLRIRWRSTTCTPEPGGPLCERRCRWALDPRHLATYSGCTNCLDCVERCPSEPKSLDIAPRSR